MSSYLVCILVGMPLCIFLHFYFLARFYHLIIYLLLHFRKTHQPSFLLTGTTGAVPFNCGGVFMVSFRSFHRPVFHCTINKWTWKAWERDYCFPVALPYTYHMFTKMVRRDFPFSGRPRKEIAMNNSSNVIRL